MVSSEQMVNSFTIPPSCLLAKMAKVVSLIGRPPKYYKAPGAVYIVSYKERLDQSDCWKLFVQL